MQAISFGQYKLVRRIGAGGMGEVFLARDEAALPPRACVVKKVLPHLAQNRAFVGRFLDEAKVVVNLSHQNIARVYAMGQADGHYYLAMEYVQGKTVSRFMHRLRQRNQVLPLGIILLIGERMCRGLAYAHDATDSHGEPLHLVHRDLSPANVCVSYRGDVKIIDFGAAQSTLKEEQTAPRVVIGNLAYMSPEQARKQRVDRRADVYSAAAVLWELLAWKPLPQKGDPVERWRKAANPVWEPPSLHRPEIPPEVDAVILRALSKEPEDRPPDAAAFGEELERLRARFAPGVGEYALCELLSQCFAEEKLAEDKVLADITRHDPSDEVWPDDEETLLVPPTALAFEHAAFVDPVPSPPPASTASLDDPDTEPSAPDPRLTAKPPTISGSRVVFGVSVAEPNPFAERSLAREIEALLEEEGEDPAYRTESVVVPGPSPLPRWLVYTATFLGALGVGFASVWLLSG